jgi:predicted ATPase/DNA-binding CsgD family transcriptional regulator/Tfp pilus assembly protein PilF
LGLAPDQQIAFIQFARATPGVSPTVSPAVIATLTPRRTAHQQHMNLPVPPTTLIGREQELVAIRRRLLHDRTRLLTLIGPPGIGKTCLGLRATTDLRDSFEDGACFVELAPIRDPALVTTAIAQALELKETGSHPLVPTLKACLHDRELLLVLDNFEHLLTAVPLVTELLAVCPWLQVLVTSRAALHIRNERLFPVLPLALPNRRTGRLDVETIGQSPAVTLFVERVQAVQPTFVLTQANAAAVAEICQRLDGLPLAIELAAARSKLFTPETLLIRLDKRLKVLVGGARDLPVRQQTLRAATDWSYDLLDVGEQKLFARLAVFVGGCTLDAVARICNVNGDLPADGVDGVAALLDNSLLRQDTRATDEPRFTMLETIREYALERLVASGEAEALWRRHAEYFRALAESADPHLEGADQAMWMERLEAEHANLRTALEWGLTDESSTIGLQLAGALWRFWWGHGYSTEGCQWLERALSRSSGAPASVRAKLLAGAGWLAFLQGDAVRARQLSEECLALGREQGDTWLIAFALRNLGWIAKGQGRYDQATTLLQESLTLARDIGDLFLAADSLAGLGYVAWRRGDYSHAQSLFEEDLALCRQLQFQGGIAWGLCDLGELAYHQSDYTRAAALLEQSLMIRRKLGNQEEVAWTLHCLGEVALAQGDNLTAQMYQQECLRIEQELGNKQRIAAALTSLALVLHAQGKVRQAQALLEESLALVQELDNRVGIAAVLDGFAALALTKGDPAGAARLWGAAENIRATAGEVLSLVEPALYKRTVADARDQLGEARFTEAWAEGRAMLLEQAIAYALDQPMALEAAQTPPSTAPLAPSVTYPAGLTKREVEVLRLIAQGLTDAQVAERLVVSAHTVHAHLRSIYGKLDVTSRAAATRFAVDHHLV